MGADIRETDEVWARPQGVDLLVRLYREESRDGERLPVVISVHGGAWNHFDRTAGALYQRALAQAGNLVVAIDFRQGPAHQHPAASADIAAARRWVRCNACGAAERGCHLHGLLGSSSGGHPGAVRGNTAERGHAPGNAARDRRRIRPADDVDASVSYLVALVAGVRSGTCVTATRNAPVSSG
ncbi:MAG: alpha/beta hydrolase fold domain-containing protein [Pseudomonadales bacterium]